MIGHFLLQSRLALIGFWSEPWQPPQIFPITGPSNLEPTCPALRKSLGRWHQPRSFIAALRS